MLPTNNWIDDIQKSMSSETFKFLEHVFSEEQTEVKHQQLPLVDFINLFPSPKLKVFENSKKDFNTYQVHLHSIVGANLKQGGTTAEQKKWLPRLINFFHQQFGRRDDLKSISACVQSAKSFFLAAKAETGENEEIIVSAINFASIHDIAIFVNWIATKAGSIDDVRFGKIFQFESFFSNWQNHSMATFLLHITQLCMKIHINLPNPTPRHVSILLQSRIDRGTAGTYYNHIGFVDVAEIDMESQLKHYLPPDISGNIIAQADSPSNKINFIYDGNLMLHINRTGDVQKSLPPSPGQIQYAPLCMSLTLQKLRHNKNVICRFPFHVTKEHLMVLSSDLDFFTFHSKMQI